MKKFLFIIMSFALMMSSCSKEQRSNVIKDGKAGLSVKLTPDGEYKTKADPEVSVADFKVEIKKGSEVIKSYNKYSEMPSTVELDAGNYTIEACSVGDKEAAFNQPIYFGTKDFTIESGKVNSVNLMCSLANMKITVLCTDKFKKELKDDYVISVNNGKGILEFTKTQVGAGESGYFKVAPLTVHLIAKRALDGVEITHSIEIKDVAAKDHHILKFDAQETGNVTLGTFDIKVDVTVNDKDHNIIIDGDKPDPKPEEEYLPTITGTAGINSPLTLTDEQAAASPVVDVTVATLNGKTIQSLLVKIDSPYLTEEFLSGVDIPTTFDLANFTNDAKGDALKSKLVELGLIKDNDPVKGKTNYSFSIGAFMGLIESLPDGSPQTHKFIITVVDSDNKTTSKTLTVIRLKGK